MGQKWAWLCRELEWGVDSDRLGRWMCVFVSGGVGVDVKAVGGFL